MWCIIVLLILIAVLLLYINRNLIVATDNIDRALEKIIEQQQKEERDVSRMV